MKICWVRVRPRRGDALRLRVCHPVRSSGGQRRAGIRRFYLKDCGESRCPGRVRCRRRRAARLLEVPRRRSGRGVRQIEPPRGQLARIEAGGARQRLLPHGGASPETATRPRARPTQRHRALHSGHHGAARRAIGSITSTRAPAAWAAISSRQQRTRARVGRARWRRRPPAPPCPRRPLQCVRGRRRAAPRGRCSPSCRYVQFASATAHGWRSMPRIAAVPACERPRRAGRIPFRSRRPSTSADAAPTRPAARATIARATTKCSGA